MVLAARIKQVQSAMPVVQLIIVPLMFLSGALFPLSGLPTWLTVLTHLNPMTYAVEPMRSMGFDQLQSTRQPGRLSTRASSGMAGRCRSGCRSSS